MSLFYLKFYELLFSSSKPCQKYFISIFGTTLWLRQFVKFTSKSPKSFRNDWGVHRSDVNKFWRLFTRIGRLFFHSASNNLKIWSLFLSALKTMNVLASSWLPNQVTSECWISVERTSNLSFKSLIWLIYSFVIFL